ncbi:MAG: biotin--[acetyl-CoA-carboxylase] ligase, partial [Planctomycetes bacterium]|nr:biotin--[acetyl-CoA-carboxylase] ligase [Planctomycetota bacterium]
LNTKKVETRLTTSRISRHIRLFDTLDSTNRHVLQMRSADLDGAIVIAEKQSQGRGRRGHGWQCPTGAGLLCSVGIADSDRAIDASLLSLVVPIALCEGILAETNLRCVIKWPNDLLYKSRKLAGILIEAQATGSTEFRYAIGFGINCLQHRGHFEETLRNKATSLDMELAEPVDRERVLVAVLNALDRHLAQASTWCADEICAQWRGLAAGLGSRWQLQENGCVVSGNLIDVDPTAAIIVQLDEGGRRLFNAANTTVLNLDV